MEGFNEDARSYAIKLSQYDTHGFCQDYPHRRHHYESLANAGCYEARRDWIQYIGPVSAFGNCNPINGNFTSVVLPLCKPERLKLVAYVLECKCRSRYTPTKAGLSNTFADAFLHDNVVEGIEAKSVGPLSLAFETRIGVTADIVFRISRTAMSLSLVTWSRQRRPSRLAGNRSRPR